MKTPVAPKRLSPLDLDRLTSIDAVLNQPNSSVEIAGEEKFTSEQAVLNTSGEVLKATGPVYLPLEFGSAFPHQTIARPVYFSRLERATCYGRGVIMRGDVVFTESFRNGLARGNDSVATTDMTVEPLDIEEPCLYLDGENAGHYGHTIGEILSRLWVVEHLGLGNLKIVSGLDPSKTYIREMLDIVGLNSEQFIPLTRPVRCRTLLVPSQSNTTRTGFGSTGHAFYKWLAERAGAQMRTPRIYLSRRLVKSRPLINEALVEKLFRSYGFDIVFPETLTMRSQIALFAGATHIAGTSGSNLFGCLFNSVAVKKFVLTGCRYLLHNDAALNSASRAEMTYFVAPQSEIHGPFTADKSLLADSVSDWMRR